MTQRWANVPGSISVEVERNIGGWSELDEKVPIPQVAADELDGLQDGVTGYELVINFLSSGHHTPMSLYGGPDRVGWPEEYEDERTLHSVVAYREMKAGGYDKQGVKLSKAAGEALMEHFRARVESAEIEQPEEPDHADRD
jgi:hypothetical protein